MSSYIIDMKLSSYIIDMKYKVYMKLQSLLCYFLLAQMLLFNIQKIGSQRSHLDEAHLGWLTLTG